MKNTKYSANGHIDTTYSGRMIGVVCSVVAWVVVAVLFAWCALVGLDREARRQEINSDSICSMYECNK